jgi:hypothetical protein
MLKKIYGFSLLLISTIAFADFCPCPSNFNLIHLGDSLDQVLKTCCAPTSKKIRQEETAAPQKWSYSITAPTNPVDSVQGSVELVVIFDQTGTVTNITVNAQSLTTTNCGNISAPSFDVSETNTIKVGDTKKTVETICGKPQFIQRGIPQESQSAAPIVTELQYVGPPPVTLVFENGKLTEINK